MTCHQGSDDIEKKNDIQRLRPEQGQLRLFTACLILFISLCIQPSYAIAENYRILLIASSDNEFYQQFTSSLSSSLIKNCALSCKHNNFEVDVVNYESAPDESGYDLIVTLGVKAHKQHLTTYKRSEHKKYLHALIPLNLIHPSAQNHYSLVLDQQEATIIAVVRKLISVDKPVGFLYTKNSQKRIDEIQKAADETEVKIATYLIDNDTQANLGEALPEILPQVSAIYMLPDKSLYNRVNINEILLTGFMNHTPFIGYSKSIAKTGALASIINDKEILITDISNILAKIINGDDVPAINWPSSYKLIINNQIAESLEISLDESILNSPNVEVIQ